MAAKKSKSSTESCKKTGFMLWVVGISAAVFLILTGLFYVTGASKAMMSGILNAHPEIIAEAAENYRTRQEEEVSAKRDEALAKIKDVIIQSKPVMEYGNPDGDITIVEFFDYQCGYCKRAFPYLMEIVDKDGNIRLIFKEFPVLGETSVEASKTALAVHQAYGNDAYIKFHEAAMEFEGRLDSAKIKDLVQKQGLSYAKIKPKMESEETLQAIQISAAIAKQLAINGTPTFIIGNTIVPGAVPPEQMLAIIQDQREKMAE